MVYFSDHCQPVILKIWLIPGIGSCCKCTTIPRSKRLLSLPRYVNGTHYLQEKYGYQGDELHMFMDRWFNFGVSFVFPSALFLINMVLYLIPLPAFVKAKFRE